MSIQLILAIAALTVFAALMLAMMIYERRRQHDISERCSHCDMCGSSALPLKVYEAEDGSRIVLCETCNMILNIS